MNISGVGLFGTSVGIGTSSLTYAALSALKSASVNGAVAGMYVVARNNSSLGEAFGGYFSASGAGRNYGLHVSSTGSSFNRTYGVYGSASNSSTGTVYGGYFTASSAGTGVHYGVYGSEAAGGTGAAIYAAGDFVASGVKSAVVQTSNGHRLFYAQESPEVWFEDFGHGQITDGKAHIELNQAFLESVTANNQHPLKIFVQLTSGMPVPVVVEKGATGFAVRARDQINATFDYRVVAKRKGYENERSRKTDIGHDDPNLYPELWPEIEKKMEEERQRHEAEREQLQQQEKQEQKSDMDASQASLGKLSEPAGLGNAIDLVIPETNALIKNHPNPFNPSTHIQFEVKQAGRVTLKVYNNLGQEVANLVDEYLAAGRHTTTFDATGLPSGVYFYRLSVNGLTEVKKMELVK
jgi:hypothetical protein